MSRKTPSDDVIDVDELESKPSRTVFLIGDVTEDAAADVIAELFRLSECDVVKPIHFVISTYGGSIDDAFGIYDAMRICAAPIYTLGLGKIMSAGCLLIAAGEKGQRSMGASARLMLHGGYDTNGGDLSQQQNNLAEFKRQEKLYDQLIAKETGRTLKQVEALYLPKRLDHYMTPQACKKFGFIDEVK